MADGDSWESIDATGWDMDASDDFDGAYGSLTGTPTLVTDLDGLSDVNSSTATAGNLLIANGSDFDSVAMSGDATIVGEGTVTVANDSHAHTNSTVTLASTDLTDTADLLYETELDDFSELQAQIADKTLLNEEDSATIDTAWTFSTIVMPFGDSVGVGTTGYVGIDTSDNQLIYNGGVERVVSYKHEKCFTLFSPADADHDDIPIYSPTDGITVTNMYCRVQGGTSAVLTLSDGTNALDAMTCDADGAADDGDISNSTFSANERMEVDTGTVTGEVDYVNFCFTYTITRE
jgi:hypothetical protein